MVSLPLEVYLLEEDSAMNCSSTYKVVSVSYIKSDADAWVGRDLIHRRHRVVPVYMRAFGSVDAHAQRVLPANKDGGHE